MTSRPALHLQSKSVDIPSALSISVHNLTAKIALNRPDSNLIPAQYLRKVDRSLVERTPWIFRSHTEDARSVDQARWSKFDIRYRGVFRTLQKVPAFKNGLYEDACEGESVSARRVEKTARFQDQVVYALLSEILEMMDLRRVVEDGDSFFFLRPRLLNLQLEYLTGYRERHKDAPMTAGFVSLDFHGVRDCSRMILPVSTTKAKESLQTSLEGKFKLILAQLALSILHLRPPGDKLPDQEVFLIGLHGSRLHLLRAFFPGRKTSRLWCGTPALPVSGLAPTSPPHPPLPNSPWFYEKENVDPLMAPAKLPDPKPDSHDSKTPCGDSEENVRTFRIVGTREYDLWRASDFHDAVRVLAALQLYLMSGKAKCGFLQKMFEQFPHAHESEGSEAEAGMEERRGKTVREQLAMVAREKRQEREERRERAREWQRFLSRASAGDRFGGFGDMRHEGWDWVWRDRQADQSSSEEDEDALLNSACMSGRPD